MNIYCKGDRKLQKYNNSWYMNSANAIARGPSFYLLLCRGKKMYNSCNNFILTQLVLRYGLEIYMSQ